MSCIIQSASSKTTLTAQPKLTLTAQAPQSFNRDDEIPLIETVLEDVEEIRCKDFIIQKRYKKIKVEHTPGLVDVSYAVIKHKGKILKTIDGGVYFGLGNDTRFGLFPLLGDEEKQLIVSQDVPRTGVQWVVSFSPKPHVIFDGTEFNVGRESLDMGIEDLDKDSVYEVMLPITDFYGAFEGVPNSVTPLPIIIFKYEVESDKYLPANHLFQNYALKGVEETKKKIAEPEDSYPHTAYILKVVSDYIFAGKEKEAWQFFNDSYRLKDKAKIKMTIKTIIERHPVYRFIYRQRMKK